VAGKVSSVHKIFFSLGAAAPQWARASSSVIRWYTVIKHYSSSSSSFGAAAHCGL
jgi:hypothetical protein